ncbi:adrenocortical dysplasia protein homolog isoform X2 [Bombina bombina]|uniref:adrenocortical dysplasia protein homolog isoform X2 n=1 Tax=Bombina bombina TaxID=8345 RepID=UPI00235A9214|nr:adrenocortical dysplasia protein homolog isoform X2 [Bombina bombina]
MAGQKSSIGRPWILDVIANYEMTNVKHKAVPAQVVEFVKIADSCSEDLPFPAAVVHISDRKYFIKGIITNEAKETLERENEHFTLADIKDKIIILKDFTLCFTVVENIDHCEFYITVQNFSILPMETNTVDILNCNLNPTVRKKIIELWQNHMEAELNVKEASIDMNSPETCLTQLLNIVAEEKFNALKSCAEKCLNLNSPVSQESVTRWGAERRNNKKNTSTFSVPMNLLLISAHEEAILEQITEFRNDPNDTSNLEGPIEEHARSSSSSMSYTTALSPMCEEDPLDDIPASETVNPWNKLPSLCISVNSSSISHANRSSPISIPSSDEDSIADPDSSTPDLFESDLLVPPNRTSEIQEEISPLIFSERSRHSDTQEPVKEAHDVCKKDTSLVDTSGNSSGVPCAQAKRKEDATHTSHKLPLLSQSSQSSPMSSSLLQSCPLRRVSLGNSFKLSPIAWSGSESEFSPGSSRISPTKRDDQTNRNHNQLIECKGVKRKQELQDIDTDWIDMHSKNTRISAKDFEKGPKEGERIIKKINMECSRDFKINLDKTTPSLSFAVKERLAESNNMDKALINKERATTSTVRQNKAPFKPPLIFKVKEKTAPPVIEMNQEKQKHYDGSPFQYKYKPPPQDLCDRVDTVRIPPDLYEWALKYLSKPEEDVQ